MSRRPWWNVEDNESIQMTLDYVGRWGFWSYVDSQALAYSGHYGECRTTVDPYGATQNACHDWTHLRGDECIAAKSDRSRCAQDTLAGLPFCEFHFGDAWRAFQAIADELGLERMKRIVEYDEDALRRRYQLDAARVRDANRVLERQPERIYFFAAGDFVKIGRSIHPEQRVRTLAGTKAPDGVDLRGGELLGTIPGGSTVEGTLHRRFWAHREVGEWFLLEPIREQIEALLAEGAEAVAA